MGAEPAAPPRPDRRPLRLPRSSWITLAVATGLALVAIVLFPRSGGDAPSLASLALVGSAVTGVITVALYAIVRRDLGLPSLLAAALAVAFALIGLVKFVLAPSGLYEVNAVRALDDLFGSVANMMGAVFTAAAVFMLYAIGYRIAARLGYGDAPWRRRSAHRTSHRSGVVVAVLFAVVIVITGGGVVLLGLLLLTAPRQYVEFVFSSWAGLGIAFALVAAAALIHQVFARLGRRPELVAQIGAIVTLFWLGLGLLALYHVLWVVYVLMLGSIWPLRTVTPK